MPATEETYRSQPTLHIVFALSSIAMTLSIVWMIMADHLRPWKQVQREFQQVEDAKLHAAEKEKLQEQQEQVRSRRSRTIDDKIQAAEASAEENASDAPRSSNRELDRQAGTVEGLDTKQRFKKAELDSKRSFYDGMIDRDEDREARTYLEPTIVPTEKELLEAHREVREGRRQAPRR